MAIPALLVNAKLFLGATSDTMTTYRVRSGSGDVLQPTYYLARACREARFSRFFATLSGSGRFGLNL